MKNNFTKKQHAFKKALLGFITISAYAFLSFSNAFAQEDLKSSLIFHYAFENTLADTSGHDNAGTATGAIYFQDGKYGKAVYFDSSLSYIDSPVGLFNVDNPRTLAFWVNVHEDSIWTSAPMPSIVQLTDGRTLCLVNSFNTDPLKDPAFTCFYGGISHETKAEVLFNTWTHVALAFDMANLQISFFINGALDSTFTYAAVEPSVGAIRLGYHKNLTKINSNFIGLMDEVMLFDKLLTVDEVNLAMNNFINTGAKNTKIAGKMSLYPNPAQNTLCIENLSDTKSVTLINISGKTMKTFAANQSSLYINISELSAGMYFIRAEKWNGEVESMKFIKK